MLLAMSNNNISRRNALGRIGRGLAGIILAGGLSAIPGNSMPEKVTEANQILYDFPARIPGARRIDKYLTQDARYCLVHIRQVHPTDKGLENMSEEMRKRIANVQNSIYYILGHLYEREGKPLEVYDEGRIHIPKDFFAELRDKCVADRTELLAIMPKANPEEKRQIEEELAKLEKKISGTEDLLSLPYLSEKEGPEYAVNRLNKEGKIVILPFEDFFHSSAINKIRKKAEDEKDPNRGAYLLASSDMRDEKFIERVGQTESPLIIVVLGGGHEFGGRTSFPDYQFLGRAELGDNIDKWNRENPDRRFSLIEVTPEGYN